MVVVDLSDVAGEDGGEDDGAVPCEVAGGESGKVIGTRRREGGGAEVQLGWIEEEVEEEESEGNLEKRRQGQGEGQPASPRHRRRAKEERRAGRAKRGERNLLQPRRPSASVSPTSHSPVPNATRVAEGS